MLDFAKAPLIMGIVNVTPDSFSGDGVMNGSDFVATAIEQAVRMVGEGAAILDIGGESTRPGATSISARDEIARILPVIMGVKQRLPGAILSVDTMKARVAEAALCAGASIVNDITALTNDPMMAQPVVRHNAYVVLMHNRSNSHAILMDKKIGGEYEAPAYKDIVADVRRELHEMAMLAEAAGIARDRIILDPGIGFGKTVEQNLTLINYVERLKSLGYPIMIGASRKSFIGRVLDSTADDRLEGTAATTAMAVLRGADIIRVHDVKFMAQVAAMTKAIVET